MNTLPDPQLGRLRRQAMRIGMLARLLAWFIPLAVIGYWSIAGEGGIALPLGIAPNLAGFVLTPLQRALGAAANLLVAIPLFFALHALAKICGEYAAGNLFSTRVLHQYRRLGWALLGTTILSWLQSTLVGLAISLTLPPGQRFLTISLSSSDLLLLLATGVVFLLGAVMGVAHGIQQENAAIV